MTVVLPNIQDSPPFDAMAVPDSVDDYASSCDAQATGAISGMSVSQDTGLDMKVAVASGVVAVAGVEYTFSGAGSPFTVAGASASDRRDVVVYRVGTGIVIVEGTPCGTAGWTRSSTGLPPVKPAITASTDVVLAELYVSSGTTAIVTATNIVDKRNTLGGLDVIAGLLQGTANVESIIQAQSLDQMTPPAGNINMNSHRIYNLFAPELPGDAAQWSNVPGLTTFVGAGTTYGGTTSTIATLITAGALTLSSTVAGAGFASSGYVAILTSSGTAIVQYTTSSGSTLGGSAGNLVLISGTSTWTVTHGSTLIQQAFTVSQTGTYLARPVGGGGGGGGGATSSTSGAITIGGAGGAQGQAIDVPVTLTAGSYYYFKCGAAGTGASGGASGGVNAGSTGASGGFTTLYNVSNTVLASAGGGGGGMGGPVGVPSAGPTNTGTWSIVNLAFGGVPNGNGLFFNAAVQATTQGSIAYAGCGGGTANFFGWLGGGGGPPIGGAAGSGGAGNCAESSAGGGAGLSATLAGGSGAGSSSYNSSGTSSQGQGLSAGSASSSDFGAGGGGGGGGTKPSSGPASGTQGAGGSGGNGAPGCLYIFGPYGGPVL